MYFRKYWKLRMLHRMKFSPELKKKYQNQLYHLFRRKIFNLLICFWRKKNKKIKQKLRDIIHSPEDIQKNIYLIF